MYNFFFFHSLKNNKNRDLGTLKISWGMKTSLTLIHVSLIYLQIFCITSMKYAYRQTARCCKSRANHDFLTFLWVYIILDVSVGIGFGIMLQLMIVVKS